VRINHYDTRSYAECIAKLKHNRWAAAVDQRKKNGLAMCDRQMVGKQGYVAHEHVRDTILSGSLAPAVVANLVNLLEDDCACSLR
jgi:hypothetical protein